MSEITRTLLEETQDYVKQAKAKEAQAKKPWQVWLDAEWWFPDYWYPAALCRRIASARGYGVY